MLEKTNKPGRENKKGEVNKYDKKKLSAKAKFPIRTIDIDEGFLKHNQEFFVEYDFFFMLFVVILGLFAITQTVKMFMPTSVDSNLTFYMMMFMIFMIMLNLMKNTFNQGYFKFSDETKMEMLLSLKAFFTVFVSLKYLKSTTLFDMDIEKAHNQTLNRVN